MARFNNELRVPNNFEKSAPAFDITSPKMSSSIKQPEAKRNPQTILFCDTLAINDPICLVSELGGTNLNITIDQSVTSSFIDDTLDHSNSKLSQNSTPAKRFSSLSLPEPKLDTSDFESDAKENTEEELETCSQSSGDNVPPVTGTEKDISTSDSPLPKKFKRRNAEMYNDIKE